MVYRMDRIAPKITLRVRVGVIRVKQEALKSYKKYTTDLVRQQRKSFLHSVKKHPSA